MTSVQGSLRIWHIANPPRDAFRWPVADIDEACRTLDAIADFDLYIGDSRYTQCQHNKEWIRNGARTHVALALAYRYDLTPTRDSAPIAYARTYLAQTDAVVANVQGLEVFDAGEWIEWFDDEQNDIDWYRQRRLDAVGATP